MIKINRFRKLNLSIPSVAGGCLIILLMSCINTNQTNNTEGNTDFKTISATSIKEIIKLDSVPINIEVPEKFDMLNIDNAIKEMKYVRLETNENSIIGRIDKILMYKNSIYILDNSFAEAIYIFDIKGNHIKTISRKGHGPEEYIKITDFCLKNDTMIIFDEFGKKLLFLDQQGNYIFTKKTGFRFRNLTVFPNGDYLLITRNSDNYFIEEIGDYGLLIGTPDSIIKYKGFNNNSLLKEYEGTILYPISSLNGQYSFAPLHSNYIYQINSDGSYFEKYKLIFKNGLPENYFQKTDSKNFDSYVKSNKISFFHGAFVENESHLFLRFNPPGDAYGYVIYDKIRSTLICYDRFTFPDDKYLGFSEPICTYDNYFVGYIEPYAILQKKKRFLEIHNKSTEMVDLIRNIHENDNPVLILYSFN